jgi:predicted Zn-dependent protease
VQERVGPEESAQTSYRKAVDLCGAGPDCAWPLLQIGYIYRRQSNFKKALMYFRKAVQAKPDWARPHFHLAKTLVELDDLQGARKELEVAVRLDDSKSEYQYQLAQVYRRLGEEQRATAAFARFRSMAQVERKTDAGADFSQP